ncbi:MAG: tRNA (adenosine(37)-N6)-threonylcarbamoyltransferase complex dimerization subunit type 1 TsaB [Candidatus Saccharimonadales bacterium]
MIILSIKTNQELSEIGLFNTHKKLEYMKWKAHRELSATIHKKIEEILKSQNISWGDIQGIIFYEGPGSFTGLRIGASVANALAADLDIPVVQTAGDSWIKEGIEELDKKPSKRLAIPKYGSSAQTTKPRK